jgi:hypothetical protein
MAGTNAGDSPLAGTPEAAGRRATEAFKLLGNETRLAILLALWEAHEPHTGGNAVTFTELRDRVGIRQGAQFNYHLDKLVGRFVRKTDEGYELTRPGRKLVQSIIAGTGIEDPVLEPTEIDAPCPFCSAPTAITYEHSYVYRVCTECQGDADPDGEHPRGMLSGWTFEPTGLSGRTAEEVYAASTVKTFARIALRFEGICPDCSGPVEWSFDVCADHQPSADGPCTDCGRERAVLAREACTVCKSAGLGTPGIKTLFHPAVVAFYYDHGVEVGFTGDTDYADVVRTLDLVEGLEEEVVSTDPLRIRVTFSHDGDELHLALDEEMDVVEVDRTG